MCLVPRFLGLVPWFLWLLPKGQSMNTYFWWQGDLPSWIPMDCNNWRESSRQTTTSWYCINSRLKYTLSVYFSGRCLLSCAEVIASVAGFKWTHIWRPTLVLLRECRKNSIFALSFRLITTCWYLPERNLSTPRTLVYATVTQETPPCCLVLWPGGLMFVDPQDGIYLSTLKASALESCLLSAWI